jgi:D-beta-D-heptose 7-phosphate kinase/D-beta-D-heptose 1-phosphate adenosyltransferase
MGEVLDRAEARRFRETAREHGRSVVFTNGCFDLLHRGHVDLLHRARELGDALMVGLNDDASVRRLKGEGRPLVPVGDRAVILCALADVDAVVVFSEDTPLELIRELVPDVLVKGADYAPEEVVGGDVVRAAGGRVEVVPLTPGRSTTGLLARLDRLG